MYTIRRVETRRKPERKVINITELNLSIYSYVVAKLYLAIWVAAKRSRRSLNREIGGGLHRSESSLGGVSLGGIRYSTLIQI